MIHHLFSLVRIHTSATLTALVALLMLCGCPKPPVAHFTASVTEGFAPLTVQFTDTSTAPDRAPITAWQWTIGGVNYTVQNPQVEFTLPGAYDVSLTVRSRRGADTETRTGYITVNPLAATFDLGNSVPLIEETIGQAGGQMEGPEGTPLEGVEVGVPAGALPEDTPMSVGYNTGDLNVVEGDPGNTAVEITTPGAGKFEQPVTVTLPLPSGKVAPRIPVPYRIDAQGHLHLMPLQFVDYETGHAMFETYQPGLFIWIFIPDSVPTTIEPIATNFLPETDGFQTPNRGPDMRRPGEAFGMTAFASWYYAQQPVDGAFYPRFMTQYGPHNYRGQNLIATRAYLAMLDAWTTGIPESVRELSLTCAQRFLVIQNALRNTGQPISLYLHHISTDGADNHAVLAFAAQPEINVKSNYWVSIYDPNHPGETQRLTFSPYTSHWQPYEGFDGITFIGDGAYNNHAAFDFILNDANAGFDRASNAAITVTSHESGAIITARSTRLEGLIQQGATPLERLRILINATPIEASLIPLETSGQYSFSVDIPIQMGINHLQFATLAAGANNTWIPIHNNLVEDDFTLNGVGDGAAIQATLTWDTPNTDLDLYVIDPNGNFSCYYHPNTEDGGELDIDVTSGFGPEHWTLTFSDTVRWNQDYQIRVHYYNDHSNGPTNYTVTILLYEGTDHEITTTYRGNLAVANPENASPTSTGVDWAEIATIRPEGIVSRSAEQIFEPLPGETLFVADPPSAEVMNKDALTPWLP